MAKREPRFLLLSPETSRILKARMYPKTEPPLMMSIENELDDMRCDLVRLIATEYKLISATRASQRKELSRALVRKFREVARFSRASDKCDRLKQPRPDVPGIVADWRRFLASSGQSVVLFENNKNSTMVSVSEPEFPTRFREAFCCYTSLGVCNLYRLKGYPTRLALLYDQLVLPIPLVGGYAFLRETGELVKVSQVCYEFPFIQVCTTVVGSNPVRTGKTPYEYLSLCYGACQGRVPSTTANGRKREQLFKLRGTAKGKFMPRIALCRESYNEIDGEVMAKLVRDHVDPSCPIMNPVSCIMGARRSAEKQDLDYNSKNDAL